MEFFQNPDQAFRGTDFWMLNGELSEEELIFQLNEMHEQGVRSVIARTYIGLKSDYPGEDFMQKMRVIVDHAKKIGMHIFVQAGYMPEAVLDLPTELSLYYLCVEEQNGEQTENSAQLEKHFGSFADKTRTKHLLTKDGYVYTSRPSVRALNLFQKDAILFYIRQSYDLWLPFADEFGKTITAIWVDEPSYHPQHLPWFDGLEDIFNEKYGYSLTEHLNELYFDVGEFKKVRYHYWTLLQKLMEENYFALIHEWCQAHGLLFAGHLMGEDTFHFQICRACAILPYYKYFDIPGIDILTGDLPFAKNGIPGVEGTTGYRFHLYLTPKQCVSAAHQAGKKHILCEMYGVTGNGMSFRDFTHYYDELAVCGINYRSVHGIFYSLHGRSKRKFPPQINYYQPYFEKYHLVNEYCTRVSAFISEGTPVADNLVLHPLETAYMYYRGPIDATDPSGVSVESEGVARMDALFEQLLRDLDANHIAYEHGDINTIASGMARVENGRFVIGKMAYKRVILPYNEVLNKETALLLRTFIKAGGEVLSIGGLPTLLDGERCNMTAYLAGATLFSDIPSLLSDLCARAESYHIACDRDSGSVQVLRTEKENMQYFMLFNRDCQSPRNVKISLQGSYRAEFFDAVTGEVFTLPACYRGEKTEFSLSLAEGGSALVRLIKKATAVKTICEQRSMTATIPIDAPFSFAPQNENVLLLEYCAFKTAKDGEYLGPYTALAVNRILSEKEYHGPLFQRFTFRSDRIFTGLSLALEDAAECTVSFNGVKAAAYDGEQYYFSKDFQKIALPDACRIGENVIEITRTYTTLSKATSGITSLFETQRGSELESVYLLGDFGVYAPLQQSLSGTVRMSNRYWLSEKKTETEGELCESGLPFFAGKVALTKKFTFDDYKSIYESIFLSIGDFRGSVAEVFLNGKSLGCVYRSPYRVNVKDALQNGENVLTVMLYNTLRPILGPYHNPRGEVGSCWGDGYSGPDSAWTGSDKEDRPWYLNTETDSETWTNGYHHVPFGIGDVRLLLSVSLLPEYNDIT